MVINTIIKIAYKHTNIVLILLNLFSVQDSKVNGIQYFQ